jgi:excisionase family DNA binding protein
MIAVNHEYLTAKEVAVLFRISERQVTRLAERGEIPGVRLGSRWRFRQSELTAWAQSNNPKDK